MYAKMYVLGQKTQFKLYLFLLFSASQAQLSPVFGLSRAHLSRLPTRGQLLVK